MALRDERIRKHALVVVSVLLACPTSAVAGSGWSVAERPAWVTEVAWEVPSEPPEGPPSGGVDYLLFDLQMNALDRPATYYRTVKRFADEAGVQRDAEIRIDFDALYQEVEIHGIRIHRDGEVLDRLAATAFDVFEQESTRGEGLYRAVRSIRGYVEDVRVGDVLEFDHTVHGTNPVFGDHVVDALGMGWSVPVGRVRRSILWPAARPLFLLPRRGAQEPSVRREGDVLRYVWDLRDVPATIAEDDLPPWYDPYPWVQVSTFGTWSDVVAWGLELYPLDESPPAEMLRLVVERAGKDADPARIVEAALRVVQDEIRYLAIGLAESSHRPTPPAEVAARRFGDCKDKSLLLVSLLRSLGVDATTAFVSTAWRGHVRELHPSPLAFNHAIVRARVEGRSYWLDPTNTHQRGRLDLLAVPPYGAALVLEPGTESLEPIPMPEREHEDTIVVVRFELGDGEGPADLRVWTTYRRGEADDIRFFLRTSSQEELEKGYVDFYAAEYPSIEMVDPVTWTDIDDENVTIVEEHYRIPEFWSADEPSGIGEGEFYPLELEHRLRHGSGGSRTMPLGIDHPDHVRIVIEARFDDGWDVTPESHRVDDPAFLYATRVAVDDDLLRLTHWFRSKADHVPPERVPEYRSRVLEAYERLAFRIQSSGRAAASEGGRVNWMVLLIAVLVSAGVTVLAVRVYRWTPAPWPLDPEGADRASAGLGGWLALMGVGLVLSPIRMLAETATLLPVFTPSTWNALTSPGSASYHPAWAPALLGELAINIAQFAAAVLVVVLYFRRRTSFPRVAIALMVATPILSILDAGVFASITGEGLEPESKREIGFGGFRSAVWIAYLVSSVRVRKTFVRGAERAVSDAIADLPDEGPELPSAESES